MRILLASFCLLCGCSSASVHEVTFEDPAALEQLEFTDRAAWRWNGEGGVPSLELIGPSDYQPPVRSPLSIALLPAEVGDFLLELDLLQTGRDYGHRDLCLFFGYVDPSHFYYVHLATTPDERAHNVFLVDGAPRRPLAGVAEQGVEWGRGAWHHVKLERRDDQVRVWFDGELTLQAEDGTFRRGRVGLGSFDDSGRFARVRITSLD